MFPFSPGRIFFFLSLLISPLFFFVGCKNNDSYVSTDPTQISIVDYSTTEPEIINSLDSALNSFQLPGTAEPFFSLIDIRTPNREKLPQTPNLLLLLFTETLKTDSALGRIFSKDVREKAIKSEDAVFIKRENLFYDGQVVWVILYNSREGLQRFFANRLLSAIATIMSTNINRIISQGASGSRFETDLSAELKNEWGVELKLPEGFEKVSGIPVGDAFYRRGAGTKNEEWILISDITINNTTAIDSLRDGITSKLIRYQDGSVMRTVSIFDYFGKPGYYRGRWETAPYPMAGLFTARVLNWGNKRIYIEAGIYSPGRNKTLNLLRLEKLLRDL